MKQRNSFFNIILFNVSLLQQIDVKLSLFTFMASCGFKCFCFLILTVLLLSGKCIWPYFKRKKIAYKDRCVCSCISGCCFSPPKKISHLLIQARIGVSCTTFIKCVTFQTMTYDWETMIFYLCQIQKSTSLLESSSYIQVHSPTNSVGAGTTPKLF